MNEGTQEQMKDIDQATAELEEVKKQLDAASIAGETHLLIRGMEPWEDIIDYAKQKQVDEILIGIKKRSRVGKLLFGSTAQHVILEAPCPVVTVK
jgi:nucleotide-binding universal stress UspA family protein